MLPKLPRIIGQLETPEKPKYATSKIDKNALSVWKDAYTTALALNKTSDECIKIARAAVDAYEDEFN